MKYINYLKQNPKKILFLLFVNGFDISLITFLTMNYNMVIEESSLFAYCFMMFILVGSLIAGNYQPYKEWKDGQHR